MIFQDSYYTAISGLAYLAQFETPVYVQAKEIANHLKIQTGALTKVFRELVDKGLLLSVQGPGGGYVLAKPSREITLKEITDALKNEEGKTKCALGLGLCSEYSPCMIHKYRQDFLKDIDSKIDKISLKDASVYLRKKLNVKI